MQIPIVSGIYTDNGPDFRTSYPVNLVPVAQLSGLSAGYLKPADGLISNGTGPGVTRSGINWNDVCYRVMGSKLVSVASDGTVTTLGEVGNDGLQASMDYSFDLLGIWSNLDLFYWDGSTLVQVTDPDLGDVIDGIWIDGYFMSTDGEFLIVTELNDPESVNPLKYGSSEIDPDPVVALLELRNEACALNRYTCEFFQNIGGDLFPFQRIEGAQLQKGCIGTHACCIYQETVTFLGGGRNEQPAVYMGADGQTARVSTREIELLLEGYTEEELSTVLLESRNDKDSIMLYMHLPDRTLVYDHEASIKLKERIWHVLTSSILDFSQYLARNLVYAYGKWLTGDPTSSTVGYLSDTIGEHYDERVRWEFGTSIIYSGANGGIFHDLELIAITGRVFEESSQISTSYSLDGQQWSADRFISAVNTGERRKRLWWSRQGNMNKMRMQRFRGDSSSHLTFARLEANIEPLYN